ncbi:MAG: hypothetical protein HUU08_03525 [Candidatus Brocadia sp.]|nr:hypothetical protein [Candidatus Brocadia sp.]
MKSDIKQALFRFAIYPGYVLCDMELEIMELLRCRVVRGIDFYMKIFILFRRFFGMVD